MNWLPEHECSLFLSHNEHHHEKKTVKQYYKKNQFVNDEEWQKAIATDSVWSLSWWPETCGGSYVITASTLGALQTRLKASKWP